MELPARTAGAPQSLSLVATCQPAPRREGKEAGPGPGRCLMTLGGLIADWQPPSGSRWLLEEADNAPAGPPTIYRGCAASPKGAALRGPRRGSLWAGAGRQGRWGMLSAPALGEGDSELLDWQASGRTLLRCHPAPSSAFSQQAERPPPPRPPNLGFS